MKIGIDISPLQSGHKVRGVGFYLEYLKRALLENFPEHSYTFFTDVKEVPVDVDLIHYPYFDPFFVTLPLIKKHKTVVTVHDLTPLVFPEYFPAGIKGNIKWQVQKFLLHNVDAVIADSKASKKDILSIGGIPEKKVSVAYLAAGKEFKSMVDGVWQKKLREKYNLPEKFVLYVGDVTWNKNLPLLVQAIKEINVPLVMVGKALVQKNFDKTNPWNADLLKVITEIADDKRFIRLGFVPTEDLVMLYNNADIFVMPSLYEGFGLPILEAMQSGCPVITTKEGSLGEVAGDAAYYVDGNDMMSIAQGITDLYTHQQLQEKYSHKGLVQAKKFTWEKTAVETIAVYKSIL